MKLYKRLLAVCLTFVMALSCCACSGQQDKTAKGLNIEHETTVYVWYCDERYEPYLKAAAMRFRQANELLKIEPVLVGENDFLENIYQSSLQGEKTADVYLMSSDDLEKACMLGLAAENSMYTKYYTEKKYCDAAIQAATYKDKLYGYPVSFNTAFMIYNKKYAGEVENFRQLAEYCDNYTVTEENQNVQQLVTWDVSDMLLNFGFSCEALEVGGSSAEDSTVMQLQKDVMKKAMAAYASLKETYGINRASANQEASVQMFAEGKLVYTIIDAEHLYKVDNSDVDYGVCNVPSLSEGLASKALSETTLAMVNPYASDTALAKAVAHAISYDYALMLNKATGLLSARNISYDKQREAAYEKIYGIYKEATVKGQFIGADSVYAMYEIMLHKVWDGADADTAVDAFAETLNAKN